MPIQTIEAEAESLEEARQIIRGKLPQGYQVFSEDVSSDGQPKTLRASGDTVETALASAERELPNHAEVVARRELSRAVTKMLTIEAFDEQQAKMKVTDQLGQIVTVKSLTLVQPSRKSLFGIGKQPQQYQVEVIQRATVEIIYKIKAKVRAHIGRPRDRIVALAEAFAGGWPAELNRQSFDQIDLEQLASRLKRYLEMPHPSGPMEQIMGVVHYPTYQIVDGKIGRASNPAEDCKLVTTAAILTGVGRVTPMDEINSRYALQIIERYFNTNLAKFLFSLPRICDNIRLDQKTFVIQEQLVDVYKGVENVLFEIYEELGMGEVFTDQTVVQKLLSIVRG